MPALLPALALLFAAVAPPAVDPLVASSVRVTQRVEMTDAQGVRTTHTSCGSGTVVALGDRYLVVTCYHVVSSGRLGRVRTDVTGADGVAIPGKVVASDPARDLAVIEASAKLVGARPATLAAVESYPSGLQVARVGYPRAGPRKIVAGRLTGHSVTDARYPGWTSIVASPQAISGDSGGGLFRRSDGALIGVVHSTSILGSHATQISDIRRLLRRVPPCE